MARLRPRDDALRFVLRSPATVTAHLFTASGTLGLFLWHIVFTGSLYVLFLIRDFDADFLAGYSPSDRAMMGWQTFVAAHNAGFNSIDLSQLSYDVQLVLVGAMFLSSYPFRVGIRITAEEARAARDLLARVGELGGPELGEALTRYGVKAPDTRNDISAPFPFNLMFKWVGVGWGGSCGVGVGPGAGSGRCVCVGVGRLGGV